MSASRDNIFTTCLSPAVRAMLKSAHVNVFLLDSTLTYRVPEWILVDASLHHVLKDPAVLRDIVNSRIEELVNDL